MKIKNLKFFLSASILVCCLTNNRNYTVNDTMNTQDIILDFGPRNINNACTYNFHGGIDYNVIQNGGNTDFGSMLLTIENNAFPSDDSLNMEDNYKRLFVFKSCNRYFKNNYLFTNSMKTT